ncbi:hypothetical protein Tco_0248022 [Tanacetum coccineum]
MLVSWGMIKSHKSGKEVGHKSRNRCPKKVKQEEVGEVRGRAYAIKDAEPKGPNVVTVWKSVEYGISMGLDTAYWGLLAEKAVVKHLELMEEAD